MDGSRPRAASDGPGRRTPLQGVNPRVSAARQGARPDARGRRVPWPAFPEACVEAIRAHPAVRRPGRGRRRDRARLAGGDARGALDLRRLQPELHVLDVGRPGNPARALVDAGRDVAARDLPAADLDAEPGRRLYALPVADLHADRSRFSTQLAFNGQELHEERLLTFQSSSTYVAQDENAPALTRRSFATAATGSAASRFRAHAFERDRRSVVVRLRRVGAPALPRQARRDRHVGGQGDAPAERSRRLVAEDGEIRRRGRRRGRRRRLLRSPRGPQAASR